MCGLQLPEVSLRIFKLLKLSNTVLYRVEASFFKPQEICVFAKFEKVPPQPKVCVWGGKASEKISENLEGSSEL